MSYSNFIEYLEALVKNYGVSPHYIHIDTKNNITTNIPEDIFNNKDLFVSQLNKLVFSLKRDGNFKTLYRYCNERNSNIFKNIITKENPFHFELIKPVPQAAPQSAAASNNLSKKEIKDYIEAKLPNLIFPPSHLIPDIYSTIMNSKNPEAKNLQELLESGSHCCSYPVLLVYLKLNDKNIDPANINRYVKVQDQSINYNDYILYLQKLGFSGGYYQKYLKYKTKYINLKNYII
jgi:hypothetical protein